MGNSTFKILVSLAGAAAAGLLAFILLETLLARAQPATSSAALFRFQFSAMAAMGVFAGMAIVIYVRLSRGRPNIRR